MSAAGEASGDRPAVPSPFPSPMRRRGALTRAAQLCEEALRRVFADCRQLAEATVGTTPERLVVFRADPGDEQATLVAVEVYSPRSRARLCLDEQQRAVGTMLHGDLVTAASRWSGHHCPAGIVVAVDQLMIAGYDPGHCGHWDGSPSFVLALEDDPLAHRPEPYCCPLHLVPHLLREYGVEPPTKRIRSDCDDDWP